MNDINEFRATIIRHNIAVPDEAVDLIHDYCQQLWRINESINLTRHTTYDLFVTRDLLDSVRVADLLAADEEVLDIGSGGGVPGILIAILRPDVSVAVCDSVGKKAAAMQRIIESLGLSVPAYADRAERILADFRFSSLTARAVGPLSKMLRWFEPHWASIGRLLLVKGPQWVEERADARHRGLMGNLELRRLDSYPTPGRDADSVILSIERKQRNNE